MGRTDPRVDAYIEKSAEFASVLAEIRERVHAACPEVDETIKWGVPHFDYKGPMCGMAAFKQHCTFGFWKASLVMGDAAQNAEAMGHFGRITRVADLPPRKLFREYMRRAMAVNEAGVKVPRPAKPSRAPLPVPDDLMGALRKNRKALATFEGFSPSHRREYVEWITEARTDATRARRLEQAVAWLAEGKPRHWKYL